MTHHPAELAESLPPPDRLALFLDVDGTLVSTDLGNRPQRIDAVQARIIEALGAMTGGALAILSGREVAALDRFFHPLTLNCAGTHGVERRMAGRAVAELGFGAGDRAVLARLAADIGARGLPVEIEHKAFGLTFIHAEGAAVADPLFAEITARLPPTLTAWRGVIAIDIVPASAGKGHALTHIMGEAAFAGRVPVHVGDDLPDEDAFAAAASAGGHGISVRRRTPLAGRHLADHDAVWSMLGHYVERHDRRASAGMASRGSCVDLRIGSDAGVR